MRTTVLLGAAAALVITATAWGTLSFRRGGSEPAAAIDIAAIHRSADAARLPIAPVEDYHAP